MTRSEIREMFGGKCAYCGKELGKSFHVDHVKPVLRKWEFVKQGQVIVGTKSTGELERPENDADDNKFPACVRCNILKGSLTIDEWRGEIARKPKVLRRDHNSFRLAEDFGLIVEIVAPVVFWFEKYRAAIEGNE